MKYKKKFTLLLIAVMMMVMFAGCNTSSPQAPASQKDTVEHIEKQFLTMLTGGTGGTYYPIGIIFSTLWNEKLVDMGISVSSQASAGSVENLNMLKSGEADLGIAVSDFGYYAMTAQKNFEGKGEFPEIRAITGLWPELVQFIVTESSGINTIEDVVGKRLSVGAASSGTAFSSAVIMETLCNAYADKGDFKAEYLGYTEASNAMQNGQLDAINLTGGIPTSSVTELLSSSMKVKIMPFTHEQYEKLHVVAPQFGFYTIPAGTYPGLAKDIETLGFKASLFTTANVSQDIIYNLTKSLFENFESIRSNHKALADIIIEDCLKGLAAVPLHPGAVKYYQEIGIEIPAELMPL